MPKEKWNGAKRAKKFRAKQKLEKTGLEQPPLVDSQPVLLETTINIAIHGSAADERCRTEMIWSCLTMSDLNERQNIKLRKVP